MAMMGPDFAVLLRLTLPEIVIALTGLVALTVDISLAKRLGFERRRLLCILIGCAGCGTAMALAPGTPHVRLAEGMLAITPPIILVQTVLAGFTLLTLLLCSAIGFTDHIGEYAGLLLFATVAMMFLVASQNLLLIFIALEFLSLSLYMLTGFDKRSRQSAEAALKYFLFGGLSAGFLLFGISLLYGLSGSLDLRVSAAAIGHKPPDTLLLLAVVMVVIGFGFKVAAAPFHFWAPDTYQGAPTASAGFIASASKVAGFFVFAQVLTIGLAGVDGAFGWRTLQPGWSPVLTLLAALSMVAGNFAAIAQTSLRRLLAYSAVAHAGYMLLGLIGHAPQSLNALLYYVITYALAALGAFGVLGALDGARVDGLAGLAGLSRRNPGLALCMLVFLLSLAGIPPLSGFFAKFFLFGTVLASGGPWWLVALAIATSTVALYYYLRVLKPMYVVETVPGPARVRVPWLTSLTLWLLASLVVLLGCMPGLLVDRMEGAAAGISRLR